MTRYKQRSRQRKENKIIALERISILFKMARKIFDREPELAQRYVNLARKIGMRYKVRIPVEFRMMMCKHCKTFLMPGKNCIFRIRPKRETHLVATCLVCGKHLRIPLKERNIIRREEATKDQKQITIDKSFI